MVLPLFVGRDVSIKAVEFALEHDRMIFLSTQKAHETDHPQPQDLHTIGTAGMIMRMLKLPDDRVKILVQGIAKARILEYTQSDPFYSVRIEKLIDAQPHVPSPESEAILRAAKEGLEQLVGLGKVVMPDVMTVVENLDEPGRLADIIASNLGLKVELTQEILEIEDPLARLKRVSDLITKEHEVLSMQQKIQAEAKGEMDKTQREYFLREQLKAIQKAISERKGKEDDDQSR